MTQDEPQDAAQAEAVRPMPHKDVYSGWLGETVNALAPTTEADPVAILATLISAFSVMVGPNPRVPVLDDRHPVLIWPLILGHTGVGRKGMSYGVARKLMLHADPDFYAESVTSGLSSGEGLIAAVADAEDEGFDPGGKKLLVVETEYSVTMARAGREGNTLGGVLRQAWEGDNLRTMTRSSVRATSPHIGILAHITPGEFRLRVKSAEMAGGTYNRFLPIYSERMHEIPLGDGASKELISRAADNLIIKVKKARDTGDIGLTAAAKEYWRDVVYSALSASTARDGAVAQFTARATAYCRRLAAVYALADGQRVVDEQSLEAAYQLVNYSRMTAAYVLGAGTGDPNLDKLIVALVNARPDGLTRTQIANDVFAKHLSKAQLDDLMAKLVTVPGATRSTRPTGGRPVEVWTLPAEKAAKAEKASPPAETASANAADLVRSKGGADLIRTNSAAMAEGETAAQTANYASSASSAERTVTR